MTYDKIADLKFNQRIPTVKLQKSYPRDRKKICRIALSELPAGILKQLVRDEETLGLLLRLKRSVLQRLFRR